MCRRRLCCADAAAAFCRTCTRHASRMRPKKSRVRATFGAAREITGHARCTIHANTQRRQHQQLMHNILLSRHDLHVCFAYARACRTTVINIQRTMCRVVVSACVCVCENALAAICPRGNSLAKQCFCVGQKEY